MEKPNVALVVLASPFESGGDRGDDLLKSARSALLKKDLEVLASKHVVWNASDAVKAINSLKTSQIDLLVLLHATWIQDSLQYLFINSMNSPVVLWAVPYMETYSVACIQHFGSILASNGFVYKQVIGLPSDDHVTDSIKSFAKTSSIVNTLRNARIGLMGPRDTWRVANSQDMTQDEWHFSRVFGTSIVHIEINELIERIDEQSDADSSAIIEQMKNSRRLGLLKASKNKLMQAAKTYLATKRLFEKYELIAATASCYPRYGGLVNLPSSWMADEGIVLDTEGDIGHSYLLTALYHVGNTVPAALAEVGKIDDEKNVIYLNHEGSSAHSLAEKPSDAEILDCGDGLRIGFRFKALPEVTLADLSGIDGNYKMLIAKGTAESVETEMWEKCDKLFLARIKVPYSAGSFFTRLMEEGIDHHFLIKEGDVAAQLADLCKILKVDKVTL